MNPSSLILEAHKLNNRMLGGRGNKLLGDITSKNRRLSLYAGALKSDLAKKATIGALRAYAFFAKSAYSAPGYKG